MIATAPVHILRNVVSAGAGADDQNGLSFHIEIVAVSTGMEGMPFECAQALDPRDIRNTADAQRHDEMAGMHHPDRTVGQPQPHGPLPCRPSHSLPRNVVRLQTFNFMLFA